MPSLFKNCYALPLSFIMPEKQRAISALHTFYTQYRDMLYADIDIGARQEYKNLWQNKFDHYYLHLYAQGDEPLFLAIQKFNLPRPIFDQLLSQVEHPIALSKKATSKELYQFLNQTASLYVKLLLLILNKDNINLDKISFHTGALLDGLYFQENNLFMDTSFNLYNHLARAIDYTLTPYSFWSWTLRAILLNIKTIYLNDTSSATFPAFHQFKNIARSFYS